MTAIVSNPYPTQDFIVLGGMRSPGLAIVRGAGAPRSWDIQKGYAFSGATVIYTGQDLAKFDVDLFAWEPEHFAAWVDFARAVLGPPAPVRSPTSLSIQHPALNDPPLTITQVVVANVTQWEPNPDGSMLFARTISLIEYRAPMPVLVNVKKGPPGSPVAVQPPRSPEEIIIANNNAQIQELAR